MLKHFKAFCYLKYFSYVCIQMYVFVCVYVYFFKFWIYRKFQHSVLIQTKGPRCNLGTVRSTQLWKCMQYLQRDNFYLFSTEMCSDVSCMCATIKRLDCECHGSKLFSFLRDQTPIKTSVVDWTNPEVWKVVCGQIQHWPLPRDYDGSRWVLHPGKCMHRIGENIFFLPAKEDVLWYFMMI